VGLAKFVLVAVSCLTLIAQAAAAEVTIDDFEEGPLMFADAGRAGWPVDSEPDGNDGSSREQSGLTQVAGGVRLVSLRASDSQGATAALVPLEGADNGLLLSFSGPGSAGLTYNGAAGGAAGTLHLDLSAMGSIVVEAAAVKPGGPGFTLALVMSDSVRTGESSLQVETGVNVFPLSDFSALDLSDIRHLHFSIVNGHSGGPASARILDISAVPNPSSGSGLASPSLVTPASGSTVPSTVSPQFTWTPVGGATGYRIAVMEYPGALPEDPAAPGCAGCVIQATTTAPAHTSVGGLPAGRVYQWRVQALPAGRWSDPALFSTAGSVALQITSPLPGSVIGAETVQVRGIVTPPTGLEVGVQVNGSLAYVGTGKFGATVRVDDTVKVLEATARDASGAVIARHAVPISVTTPTADPAVGFSAEPEMGAVPFTVHFGFSSRVPLTLITLDADGNGVPDYAGQDFNDVTFTYQLPGLYEPTITAVGPDGTTYKASALVRVFTSAELDQLLKPKWTALKDALRAGNVSAALNQVLVRRRSTYAAELSSLSIPLSQIDGELTDLTFDEQLGRNVDYEMLRIESGTRYSYPVVFTLDEDGIWRLGAF
jgi:hypothetical protein